MKSDKPFQRGLICGSILFATIFLLLLVLVQAQEFYFFKYFRVFTVSFLPAMLAASWNFFSNRNWGWMRFIIVTIIFCVVCLTLLIFGEKFLPEEAPSLPTITFSTEVSPSWTIEMGNPITSMDGKPIGSQMRLLSKDGKRTIWVEACNSYDDFDANVKNWKVLITARSIKSGFHLEENKFAINTEGANKVATLRLRVQKDNLVHEIIGEGWMQKRFFVTCEAMGENADISDDKEIDNIISTIVIK